MGKEVRREVGAEMGKELGKEVEKQEGGGGERRREEEEEGGGPGRSWKELRGAGGTETISYCKMYNLYYSTFSKWMDLGGSMDLGGAAGREGERGREGGGRRIHLVE